MNSRTSLKSEWGPRTGRREERHGLKFQRREKAVHVESRVGNVGDGVERAGV